MYLVRMPGWSLCTVYACQGGVYVPSTHARVEFMYRLRMPGWSLCTLYACQGGVYVPCTHARVELMYLVFTRMPGESYRRRLGSLLLRLCYVFRALINSLVC